jgi:photosystem II stability/assembly factor-like uncharacterized protein
MKKSFYFFIFYFSFISFAFAQVNSDWKWSHPKPQGQSISSIQMIDNNNWVAVGFAGEFMRTTDAGSSWTVNKDAGGSVTGFYMGQGRGLNSVWFFDANTGLICGVSGWIARTTNGGVSFDTTLSPVTSYIYGFKFIDANTGYATSTNGLILKTTNQGLNWSSIQTGYSSVYSFYNIEISGTTFYVPSSSGVLVSTNSGANWTQSTLNSSQYYYGCLAISQDTCLVSGSGGLVFVTYNRGTSWTQLPTLPTSSTLRSIIKSGNVISVVGDNNYVYQTTNYGTNWTALPYNVTLSGMMEASYIYGSTWLVAGDYGIILKSTNSGANWNSVTDIRSYGQKYDIWAEYNDGKVWAVGDPSITGTTFDQVLYSSNGGNNWVAQTFSSLASYKSISMINGNTGWIVGTPGCVRKTTNSGITWDSIGLPGSSASDNFIKVIFTDVNNGYIFDWEINSNGTIWKTTNAGQNWIQIIMPDTTNYAGTINTASFINVNTGWVINYNNKPYKTTNGGYNWTRQDNTPNTGGWSSWDMQMLNENTGFISGSSGHLWKTTNGGAIWDSTVVPYMTGLTATYYKNLWTNANTGWLIGGTGVAIKTTNGGSSWLLTNTNGGLSQYGAYARATDSIFVLAYNSSILKMSRYTTNIIEWSSVVPDKYYLSQNYPNPFNPTTTIQFGIPKSGLVNLKIYDITGKEIENILNNVHLNAGTTKLTFDGSKLSSGVYFYSLKLDNKIVNTKKMMLIK